MQKRNRAWSIQDLDRRKKFRFDVTLTIAQHKSALGLIKKEQTICAGCQSTGRTLFVVRKQGRGQTAQSENFKTASERLCCECSRMCIICGDRRTCDEFGPLPVLNGCECCGDTIQFSQYRAVDHVCKLCQTRLPSCDHCGERFLLCEARESLVIFQTCQATRRYCHHCLDTHNQLCYNSRCRRPLRLDLSSRQSTNSSFEPPFCTDCRQIPKAQCRACGLLTCDPCMALDARRDKPELKLRTVLTAHAGPLTLAPWIGIHPSGHDKIQFYRSDTPVQDSFFCSECASVCSLCGTVEVDHAKQQRQRPRSPSRRSTWCQMGRTCQTCDHSLCRPCYAIAKQLMPASRCFNCTFLWTECEQKRLLNSDTASMQRFREEVMFDVPYSCYCDGETFLSILMWQSSGDSSIARTLLKSNEVTPWYFILTRMDRRMDLDVIPITKNTQEILVHVIQLHIDRVRVLPTPLIRLLLDYIANFS